MKMSERWAWAVAFVVVLGAGFGPELLTPAPYSDVQVVETFQEDDYRYVTASFRKGNCERQDVVFLGIRLGIQDKLKWEPLDGYNNQEDRTEGFQVLSGRLFTGGVQYESFEIRTRHLCDGKRVDRVFLRITVSNGERHENQ